MKIYTLGNKYNWRTYLSLETKQNKTKAMADLELEKLF